MGFENQYFTIRAIEPSVVKFSYSSNHYYSLDSGTTWSLYTANQGISLAAGETVMFKCVYNSSTSTEYSFNATTGNIEVEGNPMSLTYGDDFIGQTTHKPGAYRGLFSGCTALTSCENLDFTDAAMGNWTCNWMFYNCTNLTKAPAILPATTLANACYAHMFRGCTKLEKAPILPAETVGAYSYNTLFYGCTSLNEITCYATGITSAQADNWVTGVAANGVFHKNMDKVTAWTRGINGIPAGWGVPELDNYFAIKAVEDSVVKFSWRNDTFYYSLDEGESWLPYTTVNAGIPLQAGERVLWQTQYGGGTGTVYSFSATTGNIEAEGNIMSFVWGDNYNLQPTHKTGAFRCLFQYCTALTSCENLEFTDAAMSANTCEWMFYGCTNLEKAPSILPATTLATYCYAHMFRDCTKLEKSPILPAETAVAYSYNTLFYGCTMLNEITCYATNISNTTAYTDNWVTGVASTGVFHKNMDKITNWTRATYGIPATWDVAENDDCFTVVAESTGTVKTNIGVTYASVNGAPWVNVGTSAISVNAGDEIRYEMTINPSDGSYAQFKGSTAQFHIKGDIQSLNYGVNYKNQTVTKNYAFKAMFSECTGLTRADELIMPSSSAKTQSMRHMFSSCPNLTKAPELPATGVGASGYSYMFYGCTSLVAAPELPVEILGEYAMHWMFGGCSSLTKAPSILPATATTTACYQNMFEGCTSLTKSPILPAPTVATYAYHRMFSGCTSLNEITCLATNTGASNATSSWVVNVAPTGTFIGNKNMTSWTRGNNGIPTSWVYEDYEFELTFIDLGLPSGTLWCRNNVGAKSACAYGNYYQYGKGARTFQETSGETQYNGHRAPLETALDTATATYGNDYAMPTQTQLYELAQYCNITNQTVNGVTCLKFTSKSDSTKYIYVPAAGYYHNNGTFYGGTVQFWSSTPSYEGQYAYEFNSDYGASGWVYPTNPFNMGFSVRAVKNKGIEYVDMGLPSGTLWGDSNIGYEGGWYYKLMNGDQGYLVGQTVGAISDTATALLGAGKKIPTKEQFEELFANTTRQWVNSYQGGRWSGILYTSTINGNTLFFPAAGTINTNGQYGGGNVQVSLVCSTPSTTAGYCTNYWGNSTTELAYSAAADRNYGLVVRPVMDKASKLYLGDINIENLYLGDLRPSIYLGDTLVYG